MAFEAGDGGAQASAHKPLRLNDILATIHEQATNDGVLTIGELLQAFGARAHGPLLLTPALIAIAPIIGALPGISLSMAALMTLFALQMALGLERPWAPQFLQNVAIPGGAAARALDLMAPAARALDRVFRPRWRFLAHKPWLHLTGMVALFAALMSCVGALVPGGVVPPAVVIILIALGVALEDGLVLAGAFIAAGAAAALSVWLVQRFNLFGF